MNASSSPEIAEDASAVPDAPVAARPSRGRRLVEWFWRGRALSEAASGDDANVDPGLVSLARESIEVADRLSSTIDPPSAGSGFGTAILLYRDALASCLRAMSRAPGPDGSPPSDDGLLERLVAGAGTPESPALESARALLGHDVASVARLTPGARRGEAIVGRRLLHSAIDVIAGERGRRRRALSQRVIRTGLFALLSSALVVGSLVLVTRLLRHPNFLEKAVVRTSSVYPGFSKADGMCDGRKTRIIFHTNREDNASAEFDMGAPRLIRNIELVNRRDCCDDRAIPFVVEFSLDGKEWKEVLRRNKPFTEVHQKIPATSVRIVRVRALKKTWLHLEQVAAW